MIGLGSDNKCVKCENILLNMPCIGWTNINISFVFEVGVLLEDRSKVERANMVGAPMEQVEPII